jgi:hypothetical protein
MIFIRLFNKDRVISARELPFSLALGGSMVSFCAYGFLQHLFFIRVIELSFWGMVGMCLSYSEEEPQTEKRWFNHLPKSIYLVTMMVIGGATLVQLSCLGLENEGLYSLEKMNDGHYARWTSNQAVIKLPAEASIIDLAFVTLHPDLKQHPVLVTMILNGKVIAHLTIYDTQRKTFRYALPKQGQYELKIKVNRTWCPLFYKKVKDNRILGIKIKYFSINGMDNYWDYLAFHQERFFPFTRMTK